MFAAVVMSAPVGLVLRNVVGEPYPWLFQPSFGYVLAPDGRLDVDSPHIFAVTADGEETEVSIGEIMPAVRTNVVLLFRNNFQRAEVVDSPETADMIARRLESTYPGHQFVEIRIHWVAEEIDVRTGARTPAGEDRVSVVPLPQPSVEGSSR